MRRILHVGLLGVLLVASAGVVFVAARALTRVRTSIAELVVDPAADPAAEPPPTPPGMRWIPPGEFLMGTSGPAAPSNERPAHRVRLTGFWIDEHEVTNDEFALFVERTGYVTVAERKPAWEDLRKQLPPDTTKPADDVLVPGALVFTPPQERVPLDDASRWWSWVPGASWRHPEGPRSSIDGKGNHPVVQVAWDDAAAYAKWANKRLPTEAEWEYAARGGLDSKRFVWGDQPPTESDRLANIWQGEFPSRNTAADGYERTAPVKSFPPNGYGLHDMAGNVWEWCSDWYDADSYRKDARRAVSINPRGPDASFDPDEPYAQKRVTRGGSFLCHVDYCESYRPAARRGTAFDTGLAHLGFRCALSDPRASTGANPPP
ncbi:MAG: formylglycine-generating enzyme family protein [Planctomycetota bacterium]|nr:formylglycine-generating enzyme family protein [Planctomycetota bacterium]